MTNATPVAGWYDDPADDRMMRWWDGTAWSDQVAPHPSPATASALSEPSHAPAVTTPDVSPTEGREGWYVEDGGSHTPTQRAADAVMHRAPDNNASFPNPFAASTGDPGHLPSRRELRQQHAASDAGAVEPSPAPRGAGDSAERADTPPTGYVDAPAPVLAASFGAAPPSAIAPATAHSAATAPHARPGADAAPDPSLWSTPRFAPTPASAAIPDGPRVTPAVSWGTTDSTVSTEPAVDDQLAAPSWQAPSSFAVPSSAAELASADYEPMSRVGASAPVSLRPTRANTASAWFVAFSPLLGAAAFAGLVVAADWSLRSASGTPVWSDPLIAGAIVAGTALVLSLLIIFAVVADRRRLESFGHGRRASGWWILLGALPYLIARTVRTHQESGKGAAPLVGHVLVVTLFAAATVALPFAVPRDAPVAQMRAVESTISADLASEGSTLTVLCPDSADARIGSEFVCTAYGDDGDVAGLVTAQWVGFDGSVSYSFQAGRP
ncbi:MAG: DUF2510 domain-containing protein [Microcella sp.]